jgi:hypothetical protein
VTRPPVVEHLVIAPCETEKPERRNDLVKQNAAMLGYRAALAEDPAGTISFAAFAAGVEAALEYLRFHDRRKR